MILIFRLPLNGQTFLREQRYLHLSVMIPMHRQGHGYTGYYLIFPGIFGSFLSMFRELKLLITGHDKGNLISEVSGMVVPALPGALTDTISKYMHWIQNLIPRQALLKKNY